MGVSSIRGGVPVLSFGLLLGGCGVASDPIDLRSLARGSAPNEALACPSGLCSAEADFETPVYDLSVEALRERLSELAASEPRTELVAESAELDQKVYLQRSSVFGFPDRIRVQMVRLPEGASAILHSKAVYGWWDLGVNRRRVKDWLAQLEAAVDAGGGSDPGRE